MDEHEDIFARLQAEADQTDAGIRSLARQLWMLCSALEAQGFGEEKAFALTMHYLTAMLGTLGQLGDE